MSKENVQGRQDWANTKAAYRFLDNDRVDEAQILAGHFQATKERVAATDGSILVLHDTTEFSFQRENMDARACSKMRKLLSSRFSDGRKKRRRFINATQTR